jgi:small subunit ribosomal protein S2
MSTNEVKIQEMLESGVHFGHQKRAWNPKMEPYILEARNGVHIIDLIQTRFYLDQACKFLEKNVTPTTNILFVGTKVQAASTIEKLAKESDSHFITQRWLGGTLTNWRTISNCIQSLRSLEFRIQDNPEFLTLSKKEASALTKRQQKLDKFFSGVKNMTTLPDIVIIVGQQRELNAVKECHKLNIKTITILDTNCDPDLADLFIPANDDSIRAIDLIVGKLANVIRTNRGIN